MDIKTQIAVRNNPNLYRFLREYSYWYKYLNRNPDFLNDVIEEMKKIYKLNPSDKLERIEEKMEMLNTFIDLLN